MRRLDVEQPTSPRLKGAPEFSAVLDHEQAPRHGQAVASRQDQQVTSRRLATIFIIVLPVPCLAWGYCYGSCVRMGIQPSLRPHSTSSASGSAQANTRLSLTVV